VIVIVIVIGITILQEIRKKMENIIRR